MSTNFAYNNPQNNDYDPMDDAFANDENALDDVFTSYDANGNLQLVDYRNNNQTNNTPNEVPPAVSTPTNFSQTPEYQQLVQQNQQLQGQLMQVLQMVKGNQQQVAPENVLPLSERLAQPDGEQYLGNLIGKFVEQAMQPIMGQIQPTIQNIQFTHQAHQQYNKLKAEYPDLEEVFAQAGEQGRKLMNEKGVEIAYLRLKPTLNNRNRPLTNQQVDNLRNIADRRQVENGSNSFGSQKPTEPKTIREGIMLAMQQHNFRK